MATQGRLFALPDVRPHRMRRAAEATIRALREGERLKPGDAVLLAALRTACELVDERRGDPDHGLRLEKALTVVLAVDLRLRGLVAPESDAFADLLADLARPSWPGSGGVVGASGDDPGDVQEPQPT